MKKIHILTLLSVISTVGLIADNLSISMTNPTETIIVQTHSVYKSSGKTRHDDKNFTLTPTVSTGTLSFQGKIQNFTILRGNDNFSFLNINGSPTKLYLMYDDNKNILAAYK